MTKHAKLIDAVTSLPRYGHCTSRYNNERQGKVCMRVLIVTAYSECRQQPLSSQPNQNADSNLCRHNLPRMPTVSVVTTYPECRQPFSSQLTQNADSSAPHGNSHSLAAPSVVRISFRHETHSFTQNKDQPGMPFRGQSKSQNNNRQTNK